MAFPRVKRLDPAAGPGVAVIAQSGGMGGHVHRRARGAGRSGVLLDHRRERGGHRPRRVHRAISPAIPRPASSSPMASRSAGPTHSWRRRRRRARRASLSFCSIPAATRARRRPRARIPARSPATMRRCAPRCSAPASCFVETLEEMIDVGQLLLRYPVPPTGGAGVLTFSGALCAIAQDYCETLGLDLPPMSTRAEGQVAAAYGGVQSAGKSARLGHHHGVAARPRPARRGSADGGPGDRQPRRVDPGARFARGRDLARKAGRGHQRLAEADGRGDAERDGAALAPGRGCRRRRTGSSCCARRNAAFARWRGSPPMAGASPRWRAAPSAPAFTDLPALGQRHAAGMAWQAGSARDRHSGSGGRARPLAARGARDRAARRLSRRR